MLRRIVIRGLLAFLRSAVGPSHLHFHASMSRSLLRIALIPNVEVIETAGAEASSSPLGSMWALVEAS